MSPVAVYPGVLCWCPPVLDESVADETRITSHMLWLWATQWAHELVLIPEGVFLVAAEDCCLVLEHCWWQLMGRLALQTVADNDPGVIILRGEECEDHRLENIHLYIFHISYSLIYSVTLQFILFILSSLLACQLAGSHFVLLFCCHVVLCPPLPWRANILSTGELLELSDWLLLSIVVEYKSQHEQTMCSFFHTLQWWQVHSSTCTMWVCIYK